MFWQALISANVPCTLEPPCLSLSDGKRPDELTLIPWQRALPNLRSIGVDKFAASHLNNISRAAAFGAKFITTLKHLKYSILKDTYLLLLAKQLVCGAVKQSLS
ncbi:hypothetical protein EVAR_81644_1 [Eumeta japonica]|uniref:Uncharacterized protein n=1 Tax=Eumeta variegata TaxID=151549 RepID=A0A4C1V3D3_EUMVA|nr:hypothetical protein EVAR_81644_1 [Eumeta japonica]